MKLIMLMSIILHFAGVLIGLRAFKLTGRNFLMSLFWAAIVLIGFLEIAIYRHLSFTGSFAEGVLIVIFSFIISFLLFINSVIVPYLFDTLITKEKAKKNNDLIKSINEFHQAEKEKQNLIRLLAEKNKELENYIHSTSHDLRTPIINIDGFSKELAGDCNKLRQICRECDADREKQEVVTKILHNNIPESVNFIQKSTEKIDKLLAGLTELAKLGSVKLDIKQVDVNELVNNAVNNMNFIIKGSDVKMLVGKLPNCHADSVYLDRVFTNLISNAVKYLDKDRPGEIEISGEKIDGYYVYCVQDNGIGIAEKMHDDVFKIFKRLSPEHAEQGDGVGLNIVKRIVDRHNGRVWFESEKGEGSKFYISLPDIDS